MADDMDLPAAAISRIVKESLPEGISIAKEAKTAFVKAATQFIIHATQYSNDVTLKRKKKTLTGDHVIEAMKDIEYEDFTDVLKESLEMYKGQQGDKRKEKVERKRANAEAEDEGANDGDEDNKNENDDAMDQDQDEDGDEDEE